MSLHLPCLVPVEQMFPKTKIEDIANTIQCQFNNNDIKKKVAPGMKVAIAVGSRGIADLQQVVAAVVREIKHYGALPFIVPAMGSHGGATAEGQTEILAEYGIVEQNVGAPIVASMETVEVGQTDSGLPLYFDKHAFEADTLVLIARIKPHTDFKGSVESGLLKMMAIGLGKHKGAAMIHSQGFDMFPSLIPEVGRILLEKKPATLGVAIIENACDEIAIIQVITSEEIYETEAGLLIEAKKHMPRLFMDEIDVLIVDEIGKEISGSGMDPNITGRSGVPNGGSFDAPRIQKIIVRDITEKSHGNATGIGLADITTKRLVDKIDFHAMYTNCITSTVLTGAKIPVVMSSDQEALKVAVQTCNRVRPETAKIVWIKNTLQIQQIYISEAYMEQNQSFDNVNIVGDPFPIQFDEQGNLVRPQC
jgi:hypothetical protein